MSADLSSLVALLKSGDPAQRQKAADELGRFGRDAQPVAVALVEACEDEDDDTREQVLAALEDLGPPLPQDVAPLAAILKRPALDAAYWAATLLGRLEAQGAPAVQELIAALMSHPELAVRERAAWALGQIGPNARAARAALQQAVAGKDRRLASLATAALEKLSS